MGRGSSGIKSSGMSAKLKKSLQTVEDMIRADRTESAVVLDDDGNIIFNTSDGRSQEVTISPEQIVLAQGKTLTHNHPNGYYFSNEDLASMQTLQLKQMRATTPDGRAFVLERGTGKDNIRGLRATYSKTMKGTVSEAIEKAAFGGHDYRNSKEFNHVAALEHTKILNKWLTDNATKYGYRFREEKP